MDTVTYPDPRVAQFVHQHFVPLKVNVKQEPRLAEEYFVSWTPSVLVADDKGKVHYRCEGYFPPEDFMAHLSLGLGRYWLDRQQFAPARERFEEVARRHAGSEAGAEARYWLGVVSYKESQDPAQLQASWQKLIQEYPNSEWTRRAQIPAGNQ
ncbi:MAG TPA: thioredoxin fold domain-containing protein [Gemmataceae bacterium]